MKDKNLLVKEYQELETSILQLEKLKKSSNLKEDKLFWQIEIESIKKEMKVISLEFCGHKVKAA